MEHFSVVCLLLMTFVYWHVCRRQVRSFRHSSLIKRATLFMLRKCGLTRFIIIWTAMFPSTDRRKAEYIWKRRDKRKLMQRFNVAGNSYCSYALHLHYSSWKNSYQLKGILEHHNLHFFVNEVNVLHWNIIEAVHCLWSISILR